MNKGTDLSVRGSQPEDCVSERWSSLRAENRDLFVQYFSLLFLFLVLENGRQPHRHCYCLSRGRCSFAPSLEMCNGSQKMCFVAHTLSTTDKKIQQGSSPSLTIYRFLSLSLSICLLAIGMWVNIDHRARELHHPRGDEVSLDGPKQ
jgi:hypothetical protein